MTKIERKVGLAEQAIDDLLTSNLKRCFLPLVPLEQAAPNPHVDIYCLSTPEGDLFLKHYHTGLSLAHEEYTNYQLLEPLPFIPRLLYKAFSHSDERAIFAYEFIEGQDMHREFTERKEADALIDVELSVQAIDQFYKMDAILRRSSFKAGKIPWALTSPVRKGTFDSKEEEEEFLADYQIVFDRNLQALSFFPGFYFDRNPRNIMYSPQGKMMQVDYNVVEFSSPLFDLAKFLKNGIDIPVTEQGDSFGEMAKSMSVYRDDQEGEILALAYDRQIQAYQSDSGKFQDFSLLFNYASIHSHFFYLTKYSKMVRENRGNYSDLLSRCVYHFGAMNETIEKLEEMGEPVSQLKAWAKKFFNIKKITP